MPLIGLDCNVHATYTGEFIRSLNRTAATRNLRTIFNEVKLKAHSLGILYRPRGSRGRGRRQRRIQHITVLVPTRRHPGLVRHDRQLCYRNIVYIRRNTVCDTINKGLNCEARPKQRASLNDPPSLYVFNAAGLTAPHKIEQLTGDLLGYQIEVALISESHMKRKHSDGAFSVEGFSMFRRDREGRRKGGVVVYTKAGLCAVEWTYSKDDRQFEVLWVKIEDTHSRVTLISAVYHPPKPLYTVQAFLDYIEQSIEEIDQLFPGCLVIMGGDMK